MANIDLRKALWQAKAEGIKQYEVAAAMGVSEATIVRWLRKELPEEKKKDILTAIESLKK